MKKALSILLCLAMIMALLAGCGAKEEAPAAAESAESYKVALITMDSIDQHWITLKEGAEKANYVSSKTLNKAMKKIGFYQFKK